MNVAIEFKTTHELAFEVAEWIPLVNFPAAKEFMRFRVGTCSGLWASTEFSYDILAITNGKPVKDKDIRALYLLKAALEMSTPRMVQANLNFAISSFNSKLQNKKQ